jgi:hypothetical protein
MNDIRQSIQDAIENLPNTPHNKDKIRQFKRECRKLKLQIRYETSQNAPQRIVNG